MARSDRPRPKSPFAGDGSWNTPAERAPGTRAPGEPRESASRAPLIAVAAVAAVVGALVALFLVRGPAAPAPHGPPAIQLAAVERSAAPPATAELATAAPVPVPSAPAAEVSSRPASPASASPLAADVRKALRAAVPRLKACYEQALRAYPTAGGQATLRVELAADGRVTEASVTGATPPSLAACMQKVATTMSFAAGDAPRTVSIPLALDSQ